jgi:hypothetical protein
VAVFDLDGTLRWGYHTRFGLTPVEIGCCYCACLTPSGELLFMPYQRFPLVCIDLEGREQSVWDSPESLHGCHALTSLHDGLIYCHSPYKARYAILQWRPGSNEVRRIGAYEGRLRGLPSGRFLAVGPDECTLLLISR